MSGLLRLTRRFTGLAWSRAHGWQDGPRAALPCNACFQPALAKKQGPVVEGSIAVRPRGVAAVRSWGVRSARKSREEWHDPCMEPCASPACLQCPPSFP